MKKISAYLCFFAFAFAMGMFVSMTSDDDALAGAPRSVMLAGYPPGNMVSKRVVSSSSDGMTVVIKIKDPSQAQAR